MKNILLLLSLIIGSSLHAQGDLTHIWDQENIICKESEQASHFIHGPTQRNQFAHETDMVYQLMNWEIDPANYYIKGNITYHFKSLVPGLTQLVLDFNDVLQIHTINRNGNPLTYTIDTNQLLRINLDKILNVGAFDTLTIVYEGTPPSKGFGSFEQGTHAGEDIIWTLSEPYGARDWWPAKQDLIDKIDSVDIFITTPDSNLAASNGKLISIIESDGKLIHHWRHRYPIANYLIALAVTNYASYSQFVPIPNGDSIEILNYVYPESLESAKPATQSSVAIMQLYNELFEIYPFASEKYGHAQFGWGGGMEHQTMSFMGGFSFGLQAHEMAHQWFGDKVTCGSWRDIWLNEGFATYLSGLTLEHLKPSEWETWKTSTINSATSQPGGSVWVDDTTSVLRIFSGRLSYNKASYLLHMMRWITGDSLFYQSVRNYLNGPGTYHEFARTRDLQRHFEETSGKDFDEFLDDWFYNQGWPSYHLHWIQQSDSLIVYVDQQTSHPSVDFFEMPIPILAVLNGQPHIFRVEHTTNGQRFSFFIGNTVVDSVGFDPDKWIISRNNTVDFLLDVNDADTDKNLLLYPNPTRNEVEIKSSFSVRTAQIINAIGITTLKEVTNDRFDLSEYNPGLYTVMLRDDEGMIIAIRKLVKTE